jgi:hypothetical protein
LTGPDLRQLEEQDLAFDFNFLGITRKNLQASTYLQRECHIAAYGEAFKIVAFGSDSPPARLDHFVNLLIGSLLV